MATQLKPTNYQPIPFPAARPRVRVAFSQPATTAIVRALDDMPAATREATLEELVQPSRTRWNEARATLTRAEQASKACPSEPEDVFNAANTALAQAQTVLLTTPAPTQTELALKVQLYFDIDASEFCEPAIDASIQADTARLLGGALLGADEITIGADAEALIATARHALSPHMYDAFLQWGGAVARVLDSRNDDDAQDKASDRQTEKVRAIYNLIPVSFEDFGFKTWIAGVDAGDCSCLGPLRPRDGHGTGIRDAVASIADDLAHTSTMARELDRFACRAQFLAGTAFNLPASIADAIAASFVTAQQAFADLPVAETFVPRDAEAINTPFYRGLLVEWDKAYASFRDAVAQSEAATRDSDPEDGLGRAESYALHRLLLTPAPSPAALAIKARVFEEQECWELTAMDKVARVFTSDARRFAKLGGATRADAALLAAFEAYRRANIDHHELPASATSAEENACYDRMDAPMETLLTTRATTVEGVIAKLRYGFKAVSNDAWMDDVMLAPNSLRFREGLEMAGMWERTLWGGIEDLARIAGVSLTEEAA